MNGSCSRCGRPARDGSRSDRRPATAILLAVLAFTLLLPAPGRAQIGGDGFLFRAPRATLSLNAGYGIASARSDLFDEHTSRFTLTRRDYDAPLFGADLGIRVNDRAEVFGGFSVASSSARSQYRGFVEWIGQDSFPIEQNTRFTRIPVIAGARFFLVPQGRPVGRFAWIPSKIIPYVGFAVGAVHYEYIQEGDFVDFEPIDPNAPDPEYEIFSARIESSGWGRTGQLFGGVQYSVGRRTALTAEARYVWASADPDLVFSDLGRIDLGGVQTTVGLSFRF